MNFMSSRFEEFSSEIKQSGHLSSIQEMNGPSVITNDDMATIKKVASQTTTQTIASPQSVDIKRTSSAFPTKVFRMRASILTDLLEVSHIKSIRQVFISILVLLVLQVAIRDLFELGR